MLEIIPKIILMMLVTGMGKLVENDVITQFWRETHQFDIEAEGIPVATAPPSRLLVTKGNISITESMFEG